MQARTTPAGEAAQTRLCQVGSKTERPFSSTFAPLLVHLRLSCREAQGFDFYCTLCIHRCFITLE
jgi:hypothetical protein